MVEILLSSSALILVLAILRRLLRRRISARLQYALWLLVLVRLLVPVSLFSSPVSVAGLAAPVVTRVEDLSSRPLAVSSPAVVSDPEGGDPPAPAPRRALTMERAARWIWYAGMGVMALWFLFVNVRLARRLRRDRTPWPGTVGLPVYVTEAVSSPCLFGLLRPAIYLTPRAAEDDARARQILVHEQTHFRHGDTVWFFLRSVCLVVWWFDPLVWLAAALSRQDGELACDEGTIRALGEEARFDYGRTLVGMARVGARPSDLLSGATTMTSGKKSLRERVESIARASGRSWPAAAAAVLIAAVAVGCTYGGAPGGRPGDPGADVFKRYYTQRSAVDADHDYSRMRLEVLDAMAVPSPGPALETEELIIEPAGVIVGGNTAEIVLRVTAKELESVIREDGWGPMPNYQFGDGTALLGIFTLNREFYSLSYSYAYCDTDGSLAPNQFYLHYHLILPEFFDTFPFSVPYWVDVPENRETAPFILPLSDFGYYENGIFVPLYLGDREQEGDWNIEIALDPVSDTGKRLPVGQEITVGDYRFSLRDIQLTPLACTVRLDCEEEESFIDEHKSELYSVFFQEIQSAALTLSDGARLTDEHFQISGSGGGRDWYVILPFYGPLAVDEIESLSLFGREFSLR